LIGSIRNEVNECVVASAVRVEDGHPVGSATRRALASLAFEDHDDRLGDPP